MAQINQELAAAKEAGVTVEQVQAITAEAIRRQQEPIMRDELYRPPVNGWVDICNLCGQLFEDRNPGRLKARGNAHYAWHNQIEVRLRKLEQATAR
ncbi:hypothetical protein [Psychromicrobium lacuslunae]|uniref:Uncharacterized protein n=1 Tax=Psychromicrobium lacuslunae TaxID=1618207 RepID=A0A0D4C144_9MICC|nr:hypothetical protein [Psychromicrobium lacuslunae]AJT42412.1 hypothetical protein UM93_14545 [Psychromicrobium lacuslunae]